MTDARLQKDTSLTVGVYLVLSLNQKLLGEGIARLLAITIEKLGKRGTRFVIFALPWSVHEIEDYLTEYGIHDYVTVDYFPHKTPLIFALWKRLIQRKTAQKTDIHRRDNWSRWEESLLAQHPFLALICGLVIKTVQYLARLIGYVPGKILSWFCKRFKGQLTQVRQRYYEIVSEQYATALAERLSCSAVDCAYVPNLASPYAKHITKPMVVSFPDYVTREYPELFDRTWMYLARRNAMAVLARAAATVSFCEYVRRHHAVEYCLVPQERAFLIHHGPFPVDSYIHDSEGKLLSPASCAGLLHDYVVQRYNRENFSHEFDAYYAMALPQWDFMAQRYIMLSTQNRPYKNVLRVIRAVHLLNRKDGLNLKIIMTGAPTEEIARYIHKHYLYEDVIAITRVSEKIHSALFRCAALAIQPSLFEGGFTATLSQAVSVGVPVLLSRMHAHIERLPYEGNEETYFAPQSTRELAKKILWALENRTELLMKQEKIYHQLAQRSWDNVADDYDRVFRFAIQNQRDVITA
ncbi:MAG: glycosyltransferase [Alphaproteobacteria bacterium]|nr:glycosyltransferase [Alphaproteobacteria bacterium]